MADLVAPSGTVVSVEDELAKKLLGRGWRVMGSPDPSPAPVKRKPGRPKKSD